MMTIPSSPLDLAVNVCDLPDYESMLRSNFARPDDDLTRLIFADWLDDHGSPIWAQFIRLQIHRQQAFGADSALDREELEIVQPLLFWTRRNLPPNTVVEFRRGFLDLTIEIDHCVSNAAACRLLHSGLVESLRLVANEYETTFTVEPGEPLSLAGTLDLRKVPISAICLSRLAGLELPLIEGRLHRVLLHERHQADVRAMRGQGKAQQTATRLDFNDWGADLQEEDVRRTVETPYLDSVLDLSLTRSDLGDVLLCALGRASNATKLRSVTAHDGAGVTDRGVRGLLQGTPWLGAMRELNLSGNAITAAGLKVLLRSTLAANLDQLDVSRNPWGDEGALLMAEYASERGWTHLDLIGVSISDVGLEALSASEHVRSIQILNLRDTTGFSNAGLSALCHSPNWASLWQIGLGNNAINPATVFQLVRTTSLPKRFRIEQNQNTTQRQPTTKRRSGGVELLLHYPDPVWFDFLAKTSDLAEIQSLTITTPFDVEEIAELLSRPGWTALRELGFIDCDLTDAELASILSRADLPALQRLDLTRNQIGARGIRFLADWYGMGQLREVALGENRLGDNGAIELSTRRAFARLEKLAVHDNGFSNNSKGTLLSVFRSRVKGCEQYW